MKKLDFKTEYKTNIGCTFFFTEEKGGSLGKRLVLWAHKEKYYQREERGGRGRREGDIKGAGMFCPSSAGLQHI